MELGRLVTATHDLDTTWTERASCLRWNQGRLQPSPWQVIHTQVVDGVRGSALIELALMYCYSCPAQYDCARYAVDGEISAGTWAMGIVELEWLQTQPQARRIISGAEQHGTPVQVAVGRRHQKHKAQQKAAKRQRAAAAIRNAENLLVSAS